MITWIERADEKIRSRLATAMEDGFNEGLEQGMEQGVEQGIEQGAKEERQVWQTVVAGKDSRIAELEAMLQNQTENTNIN